VPQPPSDFRYHPAVFEDIEAIKEHNPDHAERCFDRINDWERKIEWGRVPQNHLKYLAGSDKFNFYREWVGQSQYRIIYEISSNTMTVIAVLPKGDDTYDIGEFKQRIEQL